MTSSNLFRINGLAVLVGAVVYIVYIVARSGITAGADLVAFYTEGLWVPINVFGVMGAILVLLGLPAMYARIAGSTGLLGLVGVMLIALAWIFSGVFVSLFGALVAASAPLPASLIIAFIAGVIAELVGTVLLAIPFLRRRVSPHWVGYALPGAALLTVIGDVMAPTGPASNFVINLLSNLGPVFLMVALGALGFRMWAEHAPVGHVRLPTVHPLQGSS
jgi:hypothetical protein